ncbi:hypothetical protein [Pseudomonas sp. NPDC086278]|uniref:hypothetical protein n=1 Tax=Pseudomonas sp. NPDC086278 TaxID=3390646 RepID=UPI003D01C540
MSLLNISDEQALAWVQWWVSGARVADSSWCLGDAPVRPELWAWLQRHPSAGLDRYVGLTATLPPTPQANLLPLLRLNTAQWSRVLNLVVQVCAGNDPLRETDLDAADLIWCRRLGRALQPGRWLPAQWPGSAAHVQGLRLLRAWVGEPVWQRLRLHFDRRRIEDAECVAFDNLPASRLEALWQAVAWYAITLFAEGPPHADPSQPDPQSTSGSA